MIPILFAAEAEPEALIDANSIALQDVNSIDLLASGDTSAARAFNTYGLGALVDCISCEITEERNGGYELEMEYPVSGALYDSLALRQIVLAKPNYTDGAQAFRIYAITTPIDGVVTISARHISYDLSGIPVLPFTATSASAACAGLVNNAAIDCPFTIGTQIGTIADFKVDAPASIRSWFGGREGSLIDVYGGEWHYDNYTATLKAARGADRGVVIRYGKNLIDFNQEENCENVWTGVLPYWADEGGNLVRANIINLVGNFEYRRILCLDLSADFEEQPTVAQLTTKAQSYITNNNIGIPKVSITLDWVQISELTDRVELCDTVHVVFEKIGVEASAKVVRAVWDVLKDRYSELEIGEPKTNITDTIAGLEQETEKATSSVSTVMLGAIARATAAITGNSGGYTVQYDSNGDGEPDEFLILNTPDISTATKVWRWNLAGLGYSNSGYNGTYGLAITMDGEIVADYITTGTLDASRATITNLNASNITSGTLSANYISGGTLKLGGAGNGNGIAQIYDANSSLALELNRMGMVINRTYTFYASDYTEADRTAVQQILLGNVNPTAAQLNKYDLNGDGMITSIDALRIAKFLNGTESSYTINADLQVGSTSSATIIETPGVHIRPGGMFADSGGFGTLYADIIIPKNQTTTPQITVNGTLEVGTLKTTLIQSGDNNLILNVGSGSYVSIPSAYSHGTTVAPNMVVASNGYLYRSASSSKRYKHDITDKLDEDPERLYGVRVVQFKYKDDYLSKDDQKYGKNIIGFIAEDIAEAMPGAVEYDGEGRPEMWNVHVIVPAMMELIKRQKHSIDELTAQVQNQKNEIDELRERLDRLEARFFDDGR